jgi:N6-L-threonylcarbamoyladenine synthase
MTVNIIGIESSCDETSAAVVRDGVVHSNVIANQQVHRNYGGVVPELASRAHQQNIIPVVDQALKIAGIGKEDLHAVAFTRGPGLLGALLVGTSFAKGLALSLDIPLVEVNHLHAHVLSHFVQEPGKNNALPSFPYLCLLVSGGHTQLVIAHDYHRLEVIGQTIDDAAGEAFDKCAKIIGLPYPGGPHIDTLAAHGDPLAFRFARPMVEGLNFSFSGLKTSFLYFVRDEIAANPNFVSARKADLAASIQHTIIEILIDKLGEASKKTGIKQIGIAGGVSANAGLRKRLQEEASRRNWKIYIPEFIYTTDNAGMIAITGYYKFLRNDFARHDVVPVARYFF